VTRAAHLAWDALPRVRLGTSKEHRIGVSAVSATGYWLPATRLLGYWPPDYSATSAPRLSYSKESGNCSKKILEKHSRSSEGQVERILKNDTDSSRIATQLNSRKEPILVTCLPNPREVRIESAAMTFIPAKVVAVGKEANKHRIVVRIALRKYRGSFNTLKFGENKPLMGSYHDGRLDLIYFRDPGLIEGQAFPLWTIQ
jgi:hypothetical protein